MIFKEEITLSNKMTTNKTLNFPEFDDIKVSTKTFIAMTNLKLNLNKLFDFLHVTEYVRQFYLKSDS